MTWAGQFILVVLGLTAISLKAADNPLGKAVVCLAMMLLCMPILVVVLVNGR